MHAGQNCVSLFLASIGLTVSCLSRQISLSAENCSGLEHYIVASSFFPATISNFKLTGGVGQLTVWGLKAVRHLIFKWKAWLACRHTFQVGTCSDIHLVNTQQPHYASFSECPKIAKNNLVTYLSFHLFSDAPGGSCTSGSMPGNRPIIVWCNSI